MIGHERAHFDLVVIGAGPAGEKAAVQAAYFGKRVAVVDSRPQLGGACVHTGTLPSKTLREAALYVTGFARRELYGLRLDVDRATSLRSMMGRLTDVIEQQVNQISGNLERHGVTVVRGDARFTSPHAVEVARPDEGPVTLEGDVIVIATGSSPHRPAGVPFDDDDVEDSDTILDLDRIPDSLAVIGGGVIGCEYACIFAALGTEVTLVEGRGALLSFVDPELSAVLARALEQQGSHILLGDNVASVRRVPGGPLRVAFESGRVLDVDKVLYSAGRAGNTAGLDLHAAGLEAGARGLIKVDDEFRTVVPHIHAVGDVIGQPALASTSMEQGRVAVCRAFGFTYKAGVGSLNPYGIYTIPEISTVGADERELQAAGVAYQVGRATYGTNARGQIIGDSDGLLKLVFEAPSKRLLGVHIVGERATELVHIGQMVMEYGGTIDRFIDSVFNYPTLSEVYKYAAYDGLDRLRRSTAG